MSLANADPTSTEFPHCAPVTRACHPGLSPGRVRLPGLIWDCMGFYGSQWASVGICGRRRFDERRGWMVVAAEGQGRTPLRRARRLFVKRHWLGRLGQSRTTAPNGWLIRCRRRPMRGPRAPPASTGGPARAHGWWAVNGGASEREGRNGRLVSSHDAPPARIVIAHPHSLASRGARMLAGID